MIDIWTPITITGQSWFEGTGRKRAEAFFMAVGSLNMRNLLIVRVREFNIDAVTYQTVIDSKGWTG